MAIKKQTPAAKAAKKAHGPKKHMFHEYSKAIRIGMAEAGLLTKYTMKEAFIQSLSSNPNIKVNYDDAWKSFKLLPTRAAKREFFKTLKNNAAKSEK